jgi:hypothetical protein
MIILPHIIRLHSTLSQVLNLILLIRINVFLEHYRRCYVIKHPSVSHYSCLVIIHRD